MDELHGRRLRRRRALRPDAPATGRETAESVLPEVPRVGALDALLREVDSLRLTLETDLTLAAAAVEDGHVGLASDIIDSDRDGLQSFESRALGHLEALASPQRRFRVPAAPFVAAAAVAGFLLGVVPQLSSPTQDGTPTNVSSESPSQSLAILKDATRNGDAAQALQAATILHDQLQPILAQAQSNPAAAARALALLSQEQHLLAGAADTPALYAALQTSRQLTSTLQTILHRVVAPTSPAVVAAVPASPQASSSPKPASSPKPTATPSTKPKPSPSPTPSSSPRPSSSPSNSGPLPGPPGFS